MLECATAYDIPKILACCEHHLAIDPLQRFKVLPASFSLGQQLPGCSLLRVADALRAAFHKLAVNQHDAVWCTGSLRLAARCSLPPERCDCQCCRIVRARASMQTNNSGETQPSGAFTFSAGGHAAPHAGTSNLSSSAFASLPFLACHCCKSNSSSVRGGRLAKFVPGPQEFLRLA
jgi:hypothetical protein